MEKNTELQMLLDHLEKAESIIAYRQSYDLGDNIFFLAVKEEHLVLSSEVFYTIRNVHHVYGNTFCEDLRGFHTYKSKDLAIEALGRIGGKSITFKTIVKNDGKE